MAQAVALAGQLVGVPVTVVMPRTAPAVKRTATEGYGARIVPCEPTFARVKIPSPRRSNAMDLRLFTRSTTGM